MTISEIMPTIRSLQHSDKFLLMNFYSMKSLRKKTLAWMLSKLTKLMNRKL